MGLRLRSEVTAQQQRGLIERQAELSQPGVLEVILKGLEAAQRITGIATNVQNIVGFAEQQQGKAGLLQQQTKLATAQTGLAEAKAASLPTIEQQQQQLEQKQQAQRFKEQKIPPKSLEELKGAEETIRELERAVQGSEDPGIQEFIGPVSGRVPNIARQSGLLAAKGTPKFFTFQSGIENAFNLYRKFITGAQASEKEIEILKTSFPNVTDTPEAFKAKAQAFIKTAKAKILNAATVEASQGKTRGLTSGVGEIIREQLQFGDIIPKGNNEILQQIFGNIPGVNQQQQLAERPEAPAQPQQPSGLPGISQATAAQPFDIDKFLRKKGRR